MTKRQWVREQHGGDIRIVDWTYTDAAMNVEYTVRAAPEGWWLGILIPEQDNCTRESLLLETVLNTGWFRMSADNTYDGSPDMPKEISDKVNWVIDNHQALYNNMLADK